MFTHEWKVWQKDIDESGYILRLHWTLETTDGEETVTANGVVRLSGPATLEASLIPNALFVRWAKSCLGETKMEQIQLRNELAIQRKK